MKEFLSEPRKYSRLRVVVKDPLTQQAQTTIAKSAVEPDADPLPTSNAFARESPLAGTLVDSTRSSSTPARAQQRAADAFIPTHLSDRQAGSESTYAIPQWGHWATPKSPLMFRSGTLVLARPQLPNVSDSPSRSTSDSLLQQLPGSHRDIQSVSHMSDTAPQHSNAVGSVLCKSSHSPAVERDYVYPGSVERGNRPLAMVDRQQIVQLRKDPHDKPRRLFVSPEGSILSVTMRGCFDLVERPNSKLVFNAARLIRLLTYPW
ncbi:hypothetical protein C8Q78DRAFT_49550 [Trametes maxima]|nr:hypothetical protein C8Q78DRAFT_49550 [Trametes maxima]